MSRFTLIAIVIISVGSLSSLMAQQDEFSLLMQKSPRYGGNVTPLAGVQMSGLYRLIEISATPRQGYEFAYWLGDVTDPTNSSTTVLLDSQKLVVAIFERSELVALEPSSIVGVSGGGASSAGNLTPNPVGYPRTFSSASPTSPPYKAPVYIPGPGPGDAEVPEPATLALLAVGTIMLVRRRRSK